MDVVQGVKAGERRALARLITLLESEDPAGHAALQALHSRLGKAHVIGITGSPGTGKSTLTDRLIEHYRRAGKTVGVVAVDPSSPFTGGAILGDRIRMDELAGSAELYIRSIGSRSASDGLSDNLPEMLDVMDEFGFDEVLLETVGVGQAEHAARVQVDTLALVLLPGSGDVVQAMKAGIMEMADLFVVNKADLPGAQKMATDIQRISALSRRAAQAWCPPVLLVSSSQPETVASLSAAIDRHQAWLAETDGRAALRQARARYRLRRLIERRAADAVTALDAQALEAPIEQQVRRVLEVIQNPG